jgi:hypothetical protein
MWPLWSEMVKDLRINQEIEYDEGYEKEYYRRWIE